MLGRNSYTQAEFDRAKAAISAQRSAYDTLAGAIDAIPAGDPARVASAELETHMFNGMALALDRYFVHRVRAVTGKDGNPLNELEMICDSLMNNDGILRESTVIKLIPDQSILKIQFGDPVRLTAESFERLSDAVFADLERKFL